MEPPPDLRVQTQDAVSVLTGDHVPLPADHTAIQNTTGQNAPPRSQPTIGLPTSSTRLQAVAAKLVSDFIVSEGTNNSLPRIQSVKLLVDNLHKTFANSIRPIVFGNYRNLGTHGFTAANDVATLNGITFTVAANAVKTAMIVMYNKAVSIDNSLAQLFNRDQTAGATKFPALLSLLIQSLGPYKTTTLPYKCYFIPYLTWPEVQPLFAHADYNSEYQIAFNQAMIRCRQVCMTDVDFGSKESTPWWTIHRAFSDDVNNERSSLTVFCPQEFQNRTHSISLGAVCLHATLYDYPGPVMSAQIGPFIYRGIPTEIEDIPDTVLREFAYKPQPYARDVRFCAIRGPEASLTDPQITKAEMYAFALIQSNQDLFNGLDASIHLEEGEDLGDPNSPKARKKRRKIAKRKVLKQSIDATDQIDGWNIYMCEIMYFDYMMFRELPIAERKLIITEANSL